MVKQMSEYLRGAASQITENEQLFLNPTLSLESESPEVRPHQVNRKYFRFFIYEFLFLESESEPEIEYCPPSEPRSLNIAFLYNDKKLNTANVLQKLGSDAISNQYNLETASLERGVITPMIKQSDIIFFFYFITNGREQFEEIQARVSTISNSNY